MVDMAFANRVGETLLSQYAPIALPYLFVLILESVSSLALWHAAQQTSKPNILVTTNDDTTALNSKLSRTLKKTAIKTRVESKLVLLFIVLVTALQQYLEYRSNKTKNEGSPAENYYLNADIIDLSWADILYLSTLFLPTIKIISRMLSLFLGNQFRLVLRDCDGHPFAIVRKRPKARLRSKIIILFFSIAPTVSAFWFRNKFAIGIVNASMAHLFVSGIPTVKSASFKSQLWGVLFLTVCVAVSGGLFITSILKYKKAMPIQLLEIYTTSGVNWASFFLSMMFSLWPLQVIPFCYRLDCYLLSGTEGSLMEFPKVKFAIPGANAIYGTAAITNAANKSSPCFLLRHSIASAALFGWVFGYLALAAMVAGGLLTCSWETSTFTASVFAAPFMVIFVTIAASLRGELRRVWSYNEPWGVSPLSESEQELREIVLPEGEKEKREVTDAGGD